MKSFMAKKGEVDQKWLLVDAEEAILGRLAAENCADPDGQNQANLYTVR